MYHFIIKWIKKKKKGKKKLHLHMDLTLLIAITTTTTIIIMMMIIISARMIIIQCSKLGADILMKILSRWEQKENAILIMY